MRIISQNGYDFPYEQIVVMIDGDSVKCKPVSDFVSRHDLLGMYGTEERAQEVFKELHDYISYEDESKMFYMPDK